MAKILPTTVCMLASGAALADDPLPRGKPEEVGLSSERLARIGAVLKADIEAGRIPGAVIAIARRGKLVALDAYGWRDKAGGLAMTTDTIFNIASMTKPMTTVGGLMLYEQGKILIDDPLSKYFPKFANMQVAAARGWRANRRNRAGQSPDHDTRPDAPHLRTDLRRSWQYAWCTRCIRQAAAMRPATMMARLS